MKYKGKGKYIQYNTIQYNTRKSTWRAASKTAVKRNTNNIQEHKIKYKNIQWNTRERANTWKEIHLDSSQQDSGEKKTLGRFWCWGTQTMGRLQHLIIFKNYYKLLYEISRSKRISGHMIALTKKCQTVELLFEVV